ncbi:Cytokinin dehydrogenase, partial [Sarracenia purpurea var. burkii]
MGKKEFPIFPIPASLIVLFIISCLMSIIWRLSPRTRSFSHDLQYLDIANRLHLDTNATESASRDFGKLVQEIPAAVLHPSSVGDIISLINFSYNAPAPFGVAARGSGHSVRGQAVARGGVVVEMTFLKKCRKSGVRVSANPSSVGFYADVGGEELWIDVLEATLEHGLAPVSWTDYLYLTVGGTLSNGGISGQAFRYGPQISNVHEMDVIT